MIKEIMDAMAPCFLGNTVPVYRWKHTAARKTDRALSTLQVKHIKKIRTNVLFFLYIWEGFCYNHRRQRETYILRFSAAVIQKFRVAVLDERNNILIGELATHV